jgi:hypothetical protein
MPIYQFCRYTSLKSIELIVHLRRPERHSPRQRLQRLGPDEHFQVQTRRMMVPVSAELHVRHGGRSPDKSGGVGLL